MDDGFSIALDGETFEASDGETILEVAGRNGFEIPTLCHDPRLDPAGACRTCLVQVEGSRRLVPACATKVNADMKVETKNERVERHLQVLLSMYAADHDLPEVGEANGNQLAAMVEGVSELIPIPAIDAPRADRPAESNPYLGFDPSLCILCARCTRYCDEVEAVSAITLSERGAATTIATAAQVSLLDTTCELCGGCVDTCPTGALFELKAAAIRKEAPPEKIRTTCNYCGVGCQMDLNVKDGKIVKVTSPPPGETLNNGNLCVKGRFAYDSVHHEDRLKTPYIRDENDTLVLATWDEAVKQAAEGLLGVSKRHGADSLGFISSSRCTMEADVLISPRMHPGCVWMPFHFAESQTNRLTNDAGDTVTGTEEYKVCAVHIEWANKPTVQASTTQLESHHASHQNRFHRSPQPDHYRVW